jgi:hypothetical protein
MSQATTHQQNHNHRRRRNRNNKNSNHHSNSADGNYRKNYHSKNEYQNDDYLKVRIPIDTTKPVYAKSADQKSAKDNSANGQPENNTRGVNLNTLSMNSNSKPSSFERTVKTTVFFEEQDPSTVITYEHLSNLISRLDDKLSNITHKINNLLKEYYVLNRKEQLEECSQSREQIEQKIMILASARDVVATLLQ